MQRTPGWYKAIETERKKQDRQDRANTRYGVFVWDGAGMYHPKDAIRIFKRQSDARKFADANIDLNYVDRTISPIYAQWLKDRGLF